MIKGQVCLTGLQKQELNRLIVYSTPPPQSFLWRASHLTEIKNFLSEDDKCKVQKWPNVDYSVLQAPKHKLILEVNHI